MIKRENNDDGSKIRFRMQLTFIDFEVLDWSRVFVLEVCRYLRMSTVLAFAFKIPYLGLRLGQ